MAEQRPKVFKYFNSLEWKEERKGSLSAEGKPGMMVATPPEFRGHPGIWSPEDLFVASVNSCIMTTFLHYADRDRLGLSSYRCKAEGILEFIDGRFIFTEVNVYPSIIVKESKDISDAEKVIGICKKGCLISNSIKSKVNIIPEIDTVE